MTADLITPAERIAVKLKYFSERVRKGEKLDACDATVISAAADMLIERDAVIAAADSRIDAALSILGRAR